MPLPLKWIALLTAGTLLLSGALFTGCSHKLAPEGHYQATPVVADGSLDDWPLPLRFSNAGYTLQYNITNDKKNLYICILSRDEATQLRILRAGMNVYLDPKGAKNKKTSIAFPIRQPPDADSYRNRDGNPITPTSNNSRKEQLLLQSDYYNATGFLNMENGQFGLTDTKSAIRVAIKLHDHDSLLVYEAIIPLKNMIGADLGPRSDRMNVSVGIVLNAIQGQRNGNGNGPRFSPVGMRGMGMGGMRGGMGGGRRYGSSANSPGAKEEENWYQFTPAIK